METASGTNGPTRRMATPGSPNWHMMLDGAEKILQEEGYGRLTSRAVAERVGVKQRLVYYYFHTMEDLIVATFRRLSERELQRLEEVRHSDRPLHEIWDICVHYQDARMISEFIALANRIDELRVEVVDFIEKSRAVQVEVITALASRSKLLSAVSPRVAAFVAASIGLALGREAEIGVTTGHAETMEIIGEILGAVERPATP